MLATLARGTRVKIVLPRTLLEPGTIPWENIVQGVESIEVEKLLNALLEETIYDDVDMEKLMKTLADRIRENSKRLEKRKQ